MFSVNRFLLIGVIILFPIYIQSQILSDNDIVEAIKYSKAIPYADDFKDIFGGVVNNLYINDTLAEKEKLCSIANEIFDLKIINNNIIELIRDKCSYKFIIDFNMYHTTDAYKKINEFENRYINNNERISYSYINETAERKYYIDEFAKIMNIETRNYINSKCVYSFVKEIKNSSFGKSIEDGISILNDNLKAYYFSNNMTEGNLDYLTATYHFLSTDEMKQYLEQYSSDEITIFYNSIYNGYENAYDELEKKIKAYFEKNK